MTRLSRVHRVRAVTEDAGMQVALIVAFFYAPLPLLLGTAAHLIAALTVRRAVRGWWRWFAA